MLDLEVLEDAILARLKSVVKGVPYIDSLGSIAALTPESPMRFPAALPSFEGATPGETMTIGTVVQEGRMQWQVTVMAEALRGKYSARKGDSGAYETIKKVIVALEGFEIHPGWLMELAGIQRVEMEQFPYHSLYAVTFAHQFDLWEEM
jgi:hypothetical protein